MSLFPKWTGKIWIPDLPERRVHLGGNSIAQKCFLGSIAKVKISDSEHPGHSLIQTNLSAPFDAFLLRHKGVRRINSKYPTLTLSGDGDLKNLCEASQFVWDDLGPLKEFANCPSKVRSEWINKFSFKTEDQNENLPGLRPPQVGALHAISAHFSVGKNFEPATVVLPTGTGKTETMLAMAVYRRPKKILVIVPTDALRNQISKKFETLGILPIADVVPAEIARPWVCKMSTSLRSPEDARKVLEASNVIVTLPNTIQASDPEAVDALLDGCSHLIVDEAHHVSAPSWIAIRDKFEGKPVVQFTATPFRRDGKRIDGRIIFNFKLGDAQDAGYYRPIHLETVEEYGDDERRDRRIAETAIQALRRDRSAQLDHLLMARAKTRDRAEQLVTLYEELAPEMKPQIVYSGSGRTQANREALEKLLDRGPDGARIIVCVDMLGEGYDLPNLKIAALHDTHKSLAITLQFIGRITRSSNDLRIGDATVVANIADPEMEYKLSNLYAEGADWDVLIKRLSEDRIDDELRLQDVVMSLKEHGNLHEHISLWNLRPSLSVQIFKTKCAEWVPSSFESVLPAGSKNWSALNLDENILVVVVFRETAVKWGNYENLSDATYDLVIAYWDKDEHALFVYSSDYKGLRIEKMAQEITDEQTELIFGDAVFNILNNVELPLVKNLGSSRVGAISFTSYFGPNVTEGLASIEKSESSLNNIACLGYEDGERVLWGATQRKGKVWQQSSGTISEWLEWVRKTWLKVSDDTDVDANITRDFLRPQKLDSPHSSYPISVQWGEQTQLRYNDKQFFIFGDKETPLYLADIAIADVSANGEIKIKIYTDEHSAEYVFKIDSGLPGGYGLPHRSGPPDLLARRFPRSGVHAATSPQ